MFIVRLVFAVSVVALLAPEQSARLMRDVLEGVELPHAATKPSADALVSFCRANPETCRDLAMAGAGLAAKMEKPVQRRATSPQD